MEHDGKMVEEEALNSSQDREAHGRSLNFITHSKSVDYLS